MNPLLIRVAHCQERSRPGSQPDDENEKGGAMEELQGLRKMAEQAGCGSYPVYCTKKIEQATGIDMRTLRREFNAGRLKAKRMGNKLYIRCEWFDEWFAAESDGGEGE